LKYFVSNTPSKDEWLGLGEEKRESFITRKRT